jgi:anti-anti-sigma factor
MGGPGSTSRPRSAMTVVAADGRHVELALAGDLDLDVLRELEERFDDPRLRDADEWILDMGDVVHMDLACAYALLRAVTRRPETVTLTVRGARRSVQRALRASGLGAIARIEE